MLPRCHRTIPKEGPGLEHKDITAAQDIQWGPPRAQHGDTLDVLHWYLNLALGNENAQERKRSAAEAQNSVVGKGDLDGMDQQAPKEQNNYKGDERSEGRACSKVWDDNPREHW